MTATRAHLPSWDVEPAAESARWEVAVLRSSRRVECFVIEFSRIVNGHQATQEAQRHWKNFTLRPKL